VETQTNAGIIAQTIQKAFRFVEEGQKLFIQVHPADGPRVRDELPLWIPVNKALQKITVEENPRLQRGGCIVDTGAGRVDARIETQTAQLLDVVEKIWQEQAGGE
jgi:flagellar assembly protein FliH